MHRLRTIQLKRGAVTLLAAATTACVTAPQVAEPETEAVAEGRAFAETHCSSCHAVVPGAISPNPASPSFEAIVNRPGLTQATLEPWLDNSHNYPDVMNFEVAPSDVSNLAAFMLTLQHEDYRPIPQ